MTMSVSDNDHPVVIIIIITLYQEQQDHRQRPKNPGSRVALLPGKFLRVWWCLVVITGQTRGLVGWGPRIFPKITFFWRGDLPLDKFKSFFVPIGNWSLSSFKC